MPDLTRRLPPQPPANDEEGWRGYDGGMRCSVCQSEEFRILTSDGRNHIICNGCHLDYTDELWNISK